MYDNRHLALPALTRQRPTQPIPREPRGLPPIHDMLAMSANPALTPEMPSALFHVPPVASRSGLVSLSGR